MSPSVSNLAEENSQVERLDLSPDGRNGLPLIPAADYFYAGLTDPLPRHDGHTLYGCAGDRLNRIDVQVPGLRP